MKRIAVIGAGLSGTLLMMNLLRQESHTPVHITWIDRNDEKDMGPAYSTNENYLLNVPVQMMGAFSEDPEHFLKWCCEKNIAASDGDFLPRKLYREYIQAMLDAARQAEAKSWAIHRMRDEATDLEVVGDTLKVSLEKSGHVTAEKVVLALGNSLPEHLSLPDNSFISDSRYIQNPWIPDLLDTFSPVDDIFFIGSGQTMVDLVTGFYRRKHKGKLTAISRRGVLPMSQKMNHPYPSFFDELENLHDILSIFKIVRKHLRKAETAGYDPRDVIDSLRPHTIAIWTGLPPEEKKCFLGHLFRYWEIIRSRIPPASRKIVNELLDKGQLRILKGRITAIEPLADKVRIKYLHRELKTEKTESAGIVINCKGPNLDYDTIENGFIRNLVSKKIIQCDPSHLGINALPTGAILQPDGQPSDRIFTVGPTLKGIVWEALATPEIRVQAENLARHLLKV
ncbi:MAG TPA: FAD/NAD(P)-binding protein [Bacteroidales bacterium]|nr:FAD/NAD(P)-binding protein [Bacteroidales bacterium]